MHIYGFVSFHVSEVIAIEYLPWSLLGTYLKWLCVTFLHFFSVMVLLSWLFCLWMGKKPLSP